jgi:hypothetical protein
MEDKFKESDRSLIKLLSRFLSEQPEKYHEKYQSA